MNREEALAFIGFMIGRLGAGYHPDTQLEEYVKTSDKSASFTKEEIDRLQPMHDEAVKVLGDGVYDVGMKLFKTAVNA